MSDDYDVEGDESSLRAFIAFALVVLIVLSGVYFYYSIDAQRAGVEAQQEMARECANVASELRLIRKGLEGGH